ncbi:DUF6895 family protein [Micromonospora vulcania]|uniref:DUF6895 family protein n=1 Tax=Micromonospora vulcania TaxID=1441873 RepID=A0ABW1H371_9ACTN
MKVDSLPAAAPTAMRWERVDIEERLLGTLRVARRTVRTLLPDTGDPALLSEKVISETALLLVAAANAAQRCCRPTAAELIGEIAAELAPHARSEALRTRIRLWPTHAGELGVAHVCLTRLGLPDPNFDAVFTAAMDSTVARMAERLPWKEIELAWLGSIGGPPRPPATGAARRTRVGTGLDAMLATRMEVYGFTHALIYLTGFGALRPTLPRPRSAVLADATAALARSLDDDDFDVAAETLLSWPYLRSPWTGAGAFGLRVLTEVEDQVGYLPGLGLVADRFAGLSAADRTRRVVGAAYHTTYVMGLLMAATLLPGAGGPPRSWAGPGARPRGGIAAELLALMPDRTPTPHWRSTMDRVSTEDRDSMADLLAAIALRRALYAHDIGLFQRILRVCCSYDLVDCAAVRQGADLLERLRAEGGHGGSVIGRFGPGA